MSSKNFFFLCVAVAFLAFASSASASVFVVDPDVGTSQANTITTGNVAGDRTELVSGQITTGAPIDLTWSDPSNPSAHHADATFFFGKTHFTISNIDNARTGGFAAQQHVRIAFTVDVPTIVTFTGSFSNSNFVDFSGRAFLQNALTDHSNGSPVIPTAFVFSSSFVAGPVPLNIVTAQGTLTPGHTYVWDTFVGSLASGNPAGSTGTGTPSLTFTEPVPEPASLVSFGLLAVAGLGFSLRRRK